MRVLQIGSDRSKRGILFSDSAGFKRQESYAKEFGELDIIGFSLCSDGAKGTNVGALHVHPTDSRSRMRYAFDALRIARTLARPDVVSVQDPFEVGLLGLLIARRLHVPLHVQVHTDFLSPYYAQHSFVNRVRVAIAGFVLRRATRVRVVSERVKSEIVARYGLKTHIGVLPIFVDVDRFRSSRPGLDIVARFKDFKTRVLIVSRLEPEKNIALAIEAFARSAPQSACLIVVGGGSERAALEDAARISGVSDRTFFEGEKDATPYYAIADLVLVPSKYEGYGMVIIEALAAGKPVLSTDVGVAREAGATVAPGKFADALAEWFANGPRTGELKGYPYRDFDEYVRAYCADIVACVEKEKRHTKAQ
jgi:glycosyltransferase involved in cell wall biosynthesis